LRFAAEWMWRRFVHRQATRARRTREQDRVQCDVQYFCTDFCANIHPITNNGAWCNCLSECAWMMNKIIKTLPLLFI
jgi:hypothetical protein